MRSGLYSVHDLRAMSFSPPMAEESPVSAWRAFAESVRDQRPTNLLRRYPEDFALVQVGWFDSSSGKLESIEPPAHMVGAQDVLRRLEGLPETGASNG